MHGRRLLLGYNNMETIIVTEKLAGLFQMLKSNFQSKELYTLVYEGRVKNFGDEKFISI